MLREDGYQVLGYVLADTDGAYPIDRVGFYLSRVPALVSGELVELLNETAGRPVTVAALRAGLETSVLRTHTRRAEISEKVGASVILDLVGRFTRL